jgi:hypothetical protein
MKRSVLFKLGLLFGLAAGSAANGQVFNVHNAATGGGFYAFSGTIYNALAYGQGALADPGNNVWNGFGDGGTPGSTDFFGGNHPDDLLFPGNPGNPYAWTSAPFFAKGPNLFSPADYSSTTAGNATSAGSHSPVTIPVMTYGANSYNVTEVDALGNATAAGQTAPARTNVPVMLFTSTAVVNGANPGAGTAANPWGLMVLSNVPPGTYDLYLYGANYDGTRGATFTVDSGTPTNGIYQTMNPYAASGSGPETNFVLGVDYTIYNNVTPDADSTIHITWGAVSNIFSGLTGEGDFNGLQLVPASAVPAGPSIISAPTSAIFAQGTTATLAVEVRGNPAPAYQWYGGSGTPVAGQTNATLALAGALASQSGNYFLVATNIYGSITSSVVTLTIAAAPIIVAQSMSTSSNAVVLYSGHNHVGLSVTAYGDGTQPLSYYWQNNGVTTAVTTNSGSDSTNSFEWVNTTASATYSCIVSNSFGKVMASNTVAVTTVPTPVNSYANALLALNPFAYWPLSETTSAYTYDYVGGNNGVQPASGASYTIGQPGPTNGFGTSSYAYLFDGQSAVDVPGANLNFSGPITLISWIQAVGSGVFETPVGKGNGSYRFDIDGNALAHFNDDGPTDAQGGPNMEDGVWHQMVGTFTGTNINLYVDGIPVANETDTAKPGSTLDLWLGGAPDYGSSRDYQGSMAQVAILTNVLSAAQILALFQAGETAPYVLVQPTNINGYVGGKATFSVTANGGLPLSYQWTGPVGTIAGATNATLVVSNLTASTANNGPGIYYCTITNPYGSVSTASGGGGNLNVSVSSPFFVQDLPQVVYGIVGSPLVLSVGEGGNQPITNQWFYGASSPPTTALHDAGRIGGANSPTLVITNLQTSDQGYYQVSATNGVAPYNGSSQIAQVIVETEPGFNTNGAGWTANGIYSGNSDLIANISQNLLTLTDGNGSEAQSIFFDTPVYVGAFDAEFTYTATNSPSVASTASLADGTTFCIQNSPEGTDALGGGGGSIGYAGITNSAALAIDLYNANPGGIQFVSGGANPGTGHYTLSTPVVLTTGHPVDFTLHYDGETLSVKMADTLVPTNVFMTNIVIGPMSQYVGSDTALIGFTAGTGGVASLQTIANFTYTPLAMLTASRSGTNVVVSWPVGVGGYTLQKSSSLTNAIWTSVSGPYNAVGAAYEQEVPSTNGIEFFRLQLP